MTNRKITKPFEVICDESNNSSEDVAQGKLNITVKLFNPLMVKSYETIVRQEKQKRERCWSLAKELYTRWHSMHATAGHKEAWAAMGAWGQGYWYGVAEYVLDNFEEKKR